ncbi:hypothetical protein BS78_01G087900 [Paspalum vaginatum]|nr:hypothetical protein BS78_01G087900 [Paspalum vaginatum]
MAPPSGEDNADPCRIHSKNFDDCLSSDVISLGKCRDQLHLLYQCRQRVKPVVGPSRAGVTLAAAAAADYLRPGSCHIPYHLTSKLCLDYPDVTLLGKRDLYLDLLSVCHMNTRGLSS